MITELFSSLENTLSIETAAVFSLPPLISKMHQPKTKKNATLIQLNDTVDSVSSAAVIAGGGTCGMLVGPVSAKNLDWNNIT